MFKRSFSILLLSSLSLFASSCPDLSIKSDSIDYSKGVLKGLESMPVIKKTYIDILKAYNNTEDYLPYVTSDGLKEVASTVIWGNLIALNYLTNANASKSLDNADNLSYAYKEALALIDDSNDNWCNDYYQAEDSHFGKGD